MKRAYVMTLLVMGISVSGFCADTSRSAGRSASAKAAIETDPVIETKMDRRVKAMTTDLGLSKSQQESVRKVLEDARDKNRAIRKEEADKHRVINDDANAKVAALLKADQKKKFQEILDTKAEGRRMSKDAAGE